VLDVVARRSPPAQTRFSSRQYLANTSSQTWLANIIGSKFERREVPVRKNFSLLSCGRFSSASRFNELAIVVHRSGWNCELAIDCYQTSTCSFAASPASVWRWIGDQIGQAIVDARFLFPNRGIKSRRQTGLELASDTGIILGRPCALAPVDYFTMIVAAM
jgi:hypothetical protein